MVTTEKRFARRSTFSRVARTAAVWTPAVAERRGLLRSHRRSARCAWLSHAERWRTPDLAAQVEPSWVALRPRFAVVARSSCTEARAHVRS
jgi:hypothetical protein